MQQPFLVSYIQEIIESNGDEQLISICSKRRHGQVQRAVGARSIPVSSNPQELSHGPHGGPPVTPEQKRCLVERMATCDGPLACHTLQKSLERYVSTCVDGPPEKQTAELKGWLMPVLAVIVDSLEQVRNNTVTKLTATRRLRCATFLLQLCSTILKTGRGSSHPECAEQPLDPPRTSGGDAALEGNKCGASADNSREDRLMPTADACAELASECLVGIVENASEIMRKYRSDATSEYSAEPCDSVDIMFWALSLVSDVIKNFARRRWTCRGGTGRVFPEREAGLVNKTVSGTSASQASQTVDDARHNTVPIGDEASSEIGSCLDILDISRLVRVIAAVPIETGSHMVDVALKWLEVTQLLADAAEVMGSPSTSEILLGTVPASLWRMSGPRRSLLPAEKPPTCPGAAFVDPEGASGPLSQAMLRLVFWMIQLDSEGRFLVPRPIAHGASIDPGIDKGDDGDCAARRGLLGEEVAAPWQSAVEALAATCDASCLDERNTNVDFDEHLTHVFCDQDDALVDMLLTNLRIYRNVYPQDERVAVEGDQMDGTGSEVLKATSLVLRNLYRRHLHPASLFASLLSNIGFDSGVLLDWLISPETSFLQYLTLFLRQAAVEWSDFATRMSGVSLSLDKQGDSGDDDELVLSEEQAERLARAISCLSGLAASVRGLQSSRLLPYNPAPLLRRIDEIVELYEQCGDADECEINGDYDMSD